VEAGCFSVQWIVLYAMANGSKFRTDWPNL
jgi:hypothetical protein